MPKLKVLELYSGIGGMHCALAESRLEYEVVAAIDINPQANKIYKHNFPESNLLQKTIESFKVHDFDKLDVDMVLMSPPCQPFVRVGLQKDLEDKRTASFLYFLKILPLLNERPAYILLENVKGFDTSQTRTLMLDTLIGLNYQVQEYLLTPLQFGIPNSRLRYYMLAKSASLSFACPLQSSIQEDLPECVQDLLCHRRKDTTLTTGCSNSSNAASVVQDSNAEKIKVHDGDSTDPTGKVGDNGTYDRSSFGDSLSKKGETGDQNKEFVGDDSDSDNDQSEDQNIAAYEKYKLLCGPLENYLESREETFFEPFFIPEKFFRRFWVMDIVTKTHHNCCCFTKRYAHHIEGAGSVLQTNLDSGVDLNVFKKRGTYGYYALRNYAFLLREKLPTLCAFHNHLVSQKN